jgi:uncharacterized protein YcaQ
LQRARLRLAQARVDGIEWYWPADEMIGTVTPSDTVHLVAPFDPVVWDRRRFELFYRFEAYTPANRGTRG